MFHILLITSVNTLIPGEHSGVERVYISTSSEVPIYLTSHDNKIVPGFLPQVWIMEYTDEHDFIITNEDKNQVLKMDNTGPSISKGNDRWIVESTKDFSLFRFKQNGLCMSHHQNIASGWHLEECTAISDQLLRIKPATSKDKTTENDYKGHGKHPDGRHDDSLNVGSDNLPKHLDPEKDRVRDLYKKEEKDMEISKGKPGYLGSQEMNPPKHDHVPDYLDRIINENVPSHIEDKYYKEKNRQPSVTVEYKSPRPTDPKTSESDEYKPHTATVTVTPSITYTPTVTVYNTESDRKTKDGESNKDDMHTVSKMDPHTTDVDENVKTVTGTKVFTSSVLTPVEITSDYLKEIHYVTSTETERIKTTKTVTKTTTINSTSVLTQIKTFSTTTSTSYSTICSVVPIKTTEKVVQVSSTKAINDFTESSSSSDSSTSDDDLNPKKKDCANLFTNAISAITKQKECVDECSDDIDLTDEITRITENNQSEFGNLNIPDIFNGSRRKKRIGHNQDKRVLVKTECRIPQNNPSNLYPTMTQGMPQQQQIYQLYCTPTSQQNNNNMWGSMNPYPAQC